MPEQYAGQLQGAAAAAHPVKAVGGLTNRVHNLTERLAKALARANELGERLIGPPARELNEQRVPPPNIPKAVCAIGVLSEAVEQATTLAHQLEDAIEHLERLA